MARVICEFFARRFWSWITALTLLTLVFGCTTLPPESCNAHASAILADYATAGYKPEMAGQIGPGAWWIQFVKDSGPGVDDTHVRELILRLDGSTPTDEQLAAKSFKQESTCTWDAGDGTLPDGYGPNGTFFTTETNSKF
jgi:hypothetical protein